jgi:hypothetical protein
MKLSASKTSWSQYNVLGFGLKFGLALPPPLYRRETARFLKYESVIRHHTRHSMKMNNIYVFFIEIFKKLYIRVLSDLLKMPLLMDEGAGDVLV